MDLRHEIVKELKRQGLSQYRLAKLSGVNQQTVNRYCNGERDLTGERLGKLMQALGLKVVRK